MMNEFEGFLDRIGEASGQKGLVEAVRRGYRVLTEGTDDVESREDLLSNLKKTFIMSHVLGRKHVSYHSFAICDLFKRAETIGKIQERFPDKYNEMTVMDAINRCNQSDLPYLKEVLGQFIDEPLDTCPITRLNDIDREQFYLAMAKRSGYYLGFMVSMLGLLLDFHDATDFTEKYGYMFDVMAREVELDPLCYADNDDSMFRNYARKLVAGDI